MTAIRPPALLFALALATALVLGGCATADKVLFQSLAGEQPKAPPAPKPTPKAERPPALSGGDFRAPPVTMPRAGTGAAGDTIRELNDHFLQLRRESGDRNSELHRTRAALAAKTEDFITAREALENRTDAGALRRSRIQLDLVYLEIDRLNALATRVGIDARSLEQIVASARAAAQLPSATAQDRRQFSLLQQQAQKVLVVLHKMLGEIHDDISNQNDYASRERDRLDEIAARRGLGPALARATPTPAAAPTRTSARTAPIKTEGRRALVTIRFNKAQTDYTGPLFEAVSHAVERRPGVSFDIVAVTPDDGGGLSPASTARIQGVMSTMLEMGVPAGRMRVSAAKGTGQTNDEIRIYVR